MALLQTQWNGNEGEVLLKTNKKLISLLVQQLPLENEKGVCKSISVVVVYDLQQI